ncbi:hypothetical protein L7F22_049744 [Adiantum nelumboides]|nr:hypothetical protein [Adiantum nelumboides]
MYEDDEDCDIVSTYADVSKQIWVKLEAIVDGCLLENNRLLQIEDDEEAVKAIYEKLGVLDLVAWSLLVVVRPAVSATAERSGVATFYTKYSPKACYGVKLLPQDGLFAAANAALFKRGAACGKRVRVRCVGKGCISNSVIPPGASGKIVPGNSTGGPINVTIVDLCSSCKRSHATLSLSLSAFAQLADPDLGSIRIRYNWSGLAGQLICTIERTAFTGRNQPFDRQMLASSEQGMFALRQRRVEVAQAATSALIQNFELQASSPHDTSACRRVICSISRQSSPATSATRMLIYGHFVAQCQEHDKPAVTEVKQPEPVPVRAITRSFSVVIEELPVDEPASSKLNPKAKEWEQHRSTWKEKGKAKEFDEWKEQREVAAKITENFSNRKPEIPKCSEARTVERTPVPVAEALLMETQTVGTSSIPVDSSNDNSDSEKEQDEIEVQMCQRI